MLLRCIVWWYPVNEFSKKTFKSKTTFSPFHVTSGTKSPTFWPKKIHKDKFSTYLMYCKCSSGNLIFPKINIRASDFKVVVWLLYIFFFQAAVRRWKQNMYKIVVLKLTIQVKNNSILILNFYEITWYDRVKYSIGNFVNPFDAAEVTPESRKCHWLKTGRHTSAYKWSQVVCRNGSQCVS